MKEMKIISAGGKITVLQLEKNILTIDGEKQKLSNLPNKLAGFNMNQDNWDVVLWMMRFGFSFQSYNHLNFYDLIR